MTTKELNQTYFFFVMRFFFLSTIFMIINFQIGMIVSYIYLLLYFSYSLFKKYYNKEDYFKMLKTKPSKRNLLLTALIVLSFYPLIVLLNSILVAFLPEISLTMNHLSQGVFSLSVLSQIILFAMIPAISEEILFRGVFLKLIGKSPLFKILLVSIMFSFAHLNPYNLISSFLLSLFLTHFMIIGKNIYYPIIGHMIFNISTILFTKYQIQLLGIRDGVFTISPNTDPELSLFIISFILLSTILGFIFMDKFNRENKGEERNKYSYKLFKKEIKEFLKELNSYGYFVFLLLLIIINTFGNKLI